MSDIKLFQFEDKGVTEIEGRSVAIEKSLQTSTADLEKAKPLLQQSYEAS